MGQSQVAVAERQDSTLLENEVEHFLDLVRQGKFKSSQKTIGSEWELVCLNKDGSLDDGAASRIFDLPDETRDNFGLTTEFGSHNVEFNGGVIELSQDKPFSRFLDEQLETLYVLDSFGLNALGCGLALNPTYQDLGEVGEVFDKSRMLKLINPHKPRYNTLLDCWERISGGQTVLSFLGIEPFRIRSCGIESLISSFQIHLCVNPDEASDALNIASFLHAATQAPFVCSPRILGKNAAYKDLRIQIWRQLFPQRTGMGPCWYNDFEHVLREACKVEQWFVCAENSPEQLPNLKTLIGSTWTDQRLKINGSVLTIEERAKGSGTPQDNTMKTILWIGLMLYYLKNKPKAWEEFGDYSFCEANALLVAEKGLDAEIHWFGASIKVSELILTTLIPLAEEGLKGINDPLVTTLLGKLRVIVETNKTVSEMILKWSKDFQGEENSDQRIMKALFDRRFESVADWTE